MSTPPCANTGRDEDSPCPNQATKACKDCHLVQYCSRDCQVAHWPVHKRDCKSKLLQQTWRPSWEEERRLPAFVTATAGLTTHGAKKYPWGNTPALDVLNLEQNEGCNFRGDLDLLFAASGDLRNVVKSLASLPADFSGNCNIVVNDRDLDIVARNVLLILVSFHYEPAEASVIMVHLWYSALLPEAMLSSLRAKLLPLIQDACSKVRDKRKDALLAKTWKCGSRSLRLVLRKEQWDQLPAYLDVPAGLSTDQAQRVRRSTTLAPHREDYRHRDLYNKPPEWRVCIMKFREDGILLPFGACRREFCTPNPTFYQTTSWPMKDSADPLDGWRIQEVMSKAPLAEKDLYGSLFLFLRDLFSKYCARLATISVSFQLFHLDATTLPASLKSDGISPTSFDRIEVSNIADNAYLGPRTMLSTFGPLLKKQTENPHATLIGLFLNAIDEEDSQSLASLKSDLSYLSRFLPITPNFVRRGDKSDADFLRLIFARDMVRDVDAIFGRYMKKHRFKEITRDAGLAMKSKNTIIPPFPMRLPKNATQKEFDLLLASAHTGSERYVEWKRLE
ncbi:hypothetical protein VTN96DRAFT_1797 [Rasamsonia emersonii]